MRAIAGCVVPSTFKLFKTRAEESAKNWGLNKAVDVTITAQGLTDLLREPPKPAIV